MELSDSLLRPLLSLDVTPDGAGGGGFRGLCSVELFALSIPVSKGRKGNKRQSVSLSCGRFQRDSFIECTVSGRRVAAR